VIIFFMLSGFVLASSLEEKRDSYAGFIVKRLFRIYPAFFVVIVGSYSLHIWIGDRNSHFDSSPWFHDAVAHPSLSASNLIDHLVMRGTMQAMGLDSVIWSLVHEMRISLIFPLLMAAVVKFRRTALPVALLVSFVCALYLLDATGTAPKGFLEKTERASWITTLYFVVVFVAGILLSLNREIVAKRIAHVPAWVLYALLILSMLCISKSEGDTDSLYSALTDYLYCFSAIIIISVALGFKSFQNFLALRSFMRLGRISYSLYLVHVPIIYVLGTCLGEWLSLGWIIGLSIVVSFLVAEFLAVTVEFPFMNLGRKLSKRLDVRV
jgi:peptidoglycan/LPS O-acetylase OafA/YrhL